MNWPSFTIMKMINVHDKEDTEKTCLEKAFLQKINPIEGRMIFRNGKLNDYV